MTVTLPDELERLLETAARARGLDVAAYARIVLEEAVKRESLLAELDRIRAMTPAGSQTDSAALLQRARDERYGS